jgi:hypothetical protein
MATVPTSLAFAIEGMPYRIEDDCRNNESRNHVDHEKQRKLSFLKTAPAPEQCGNQCEYQSQHAEYQEPISLHWATFREWRTTELISGGPYAQIRRRTQAAV